MGEILDSSMQRKQTAMMLRQDCVAGLVKPGPVGTCSNVLPTVLMYLNHEASQVKPDGSS